MFQSENANGVAGRPVSACPEFDGLSVHTARNQ